METRKIQSVGGGTFTVSIPKEWAEAEGITTGDTVGLHRHIDGTLTIQTPEHEGMDKSQISVQLTPEETDAIEHTVRAAYAAGIKTVHLESTEPFTAQQQQILSRVARNLTGVSIVEDSETQLTVETLLDTDEVSVAQSVRQLRFVVLSMHRDATAAVLHGTDPQQLTERDDQADRLHALISRSFARGIRQLEEIDRLGVTRPELFELWATTRELERVGDHAHGIGTAAQLFDETPDQTLSNEIQSFAETVRTIVSDAVSVVIDDAAIGTAQQVLAARDELRADICAFDERIGTESEELRGLLPVVNRLRRTAEHGGNIAEICLQQAIRTGELNSVEQTPESDPSLVQDPPTWMTK